MYIYTPFPPLYPISIYGLRCIILTPFILVFKIELQVFFFVSLSHCLKITQGFRVTAQEVLRDSELNMMYQLLFRGQVLRCGFTLYEFWRMSIFKWLPILKKKVKESEKINSLLVHPLFFSRICIQENETEMKMHFCYFIFLFIKPKMNIIIAQYC